MPLTSDLRRLGSLASIAVLGLSILACTLPAAMAVSMPINIEIPTSTAVVTNMPTWSAPLVTTTPLPSPTPQNVCVVSTGIKDGTVNIRSGPGMNYSVIGWSWEGSELPLSGEHVDGWQKLAAYDGWFYVKGWCK